MKLITTCWFRTIEDKCTRLRIWHCLWVHKLLIPSCIANDGFPFSVCRYILMSLWHFQASESWLSQIQIHRAAERPSAVCVCAYWARSAVASAVCVCVFVSVSGLDYSLLPRFIYPAHAPLVRAQNALHTHMAQGSIKGWLCKGALQFLPVISMY